jgi:hypothetical protein
MTAPTVIPDENGTWVLIEENAPTCLLTGVGGGLLGSVSPLLLVLGAAVVGAGVGMLTREPEHREER